MARSEKLLGEASQAAHKKQRTGAAALLVVPPRTRPTCLRHFSSSHRVELLPSADGVLTTRLRALGTGPPSLGVGRRPPGDRDCNCCVSACGSAVSVRFLGHRWRPSERLGRSTQQAPSERPHVPGQSGAPPVASPRVSVPFLYTVADLREGTGYQCRERCPRGGRDPQANQVRQAQQRAQPVCRAYTVSEKGQMVSGSESTDGCSAKGRPGIAGVDAVENYRMFAAGRAPARSSVCLGL